MKVKINGIEYTYNKKVTILNALKDKGFDIPTLCYDERMLPFGSCRLCLVKVKDKGILTSCNNYIEDGMEIITDDNEIEKLRKINLKLLADNYPKGYKEKYPYKRFHELMNRYGLDGYKDKEDEKLYDTSHPYIYVNMNRCINCYNCVRVCEDVIGKLVWREINRGSNTLIIAEGNKLGNSSCISCRSCIDVCPTGAIEDSFIIKYGHPDKFIESSCTLCSVTCPIKVGVSNGKPVMIYGNDSKLKLSANCIIGKYQWENLYYSNDRVYQPLLRSENNWKSVNYDDALNILSDQIKKSINSYGPNSIGFIVANRISLEEYYLLNLLAKDIIKTNNIFSIVDINYGDSIKKYVPPLNGEKTLKHNEIQSLGTILAIGDIERHHPTISSILRDNAIKGKSNLISIDDINDYRSIHEQSDFYSRLSKEKMLDLFKALEFLILSKEKYDKQYLEKYFKDLEGYLNKISSNINNKTKEIAEGIFKLINKTPIAIFFEFDNYIAEEVFNLYLIMKSSYSNVNLIPLISEGDVIESFYFINENNINLNNIYDVIRNLKSLIIIGNNLIAYSKNRDELIKLLHNVDFVAEITPIIDTSARYYAKLIIPSPTFLEKSGHYLSYDFDIREVNKAVNNKLKQEFDIFNDLMVRLGGKSVDQKESYEKLVSNLKFITFNNT